jgi:sulfite reductase (NADPH) hemoprotein beta-component
MAALSSVARIAYLASDVLVDSRPTLPSNVPFAKTFNTLDKASNHRPTVISVPLSADPGSALLQNRVAGLTSYLAFSNPQVLTRLIQHLAELSSLPVALHLAIQNDLSDVLLLRSSVPFFLVSSTAQQAHDNTLLASRLARTEKKAVVHVFYDGGKDVVDEIAEDKIMPFLLGDKPHARTTSVINGHGNGHANGVNGHASPASPTEELFRAYESADLSTLALVRRSLRPLIQHGANDPHTVIFTLGRANFSFDLEGISFVSIALLNPLPSSRILKYVPASATRVIVLEQVERWSMKWTPLYLDVVGALQQRTSEHRPVVHTGYLHSSDSITSVDILKLIERASSALSSIRLTLGDAYSLPERLITEPPQVPKHESSYTKILTHLFSDRLDISNSPALVPSQGAHATSPEFALGRVRGQLDQRADLIQFVQSLLAEPTIDKDLHTLLSRWLLAKDDPVKSRTLGSQIIDNLTSSSHSHPSIPHILSLRSQLPALSRWIIGSDAWSYDLGSSGLHHVITSKLNINILIIDTLPYSSRHSADPNRRKRDAGLYAMNHGDVYVASIAVYSSYSQVLQSLIEADRFDGPSVVLAYLPYTTEESPALEVLKETKLAVDAGYWPLYRWDPSKERAGKEPFVLDSDAVKNDLQQFLDRQNHLSQLVRSKPQLATELVSSLGENVKEARKKRAQQSYNELLTALDAPPLLVLYASDGGSAEKVAKRLANRAKARGLTTTVATMDSTPLDTLAEEEHVVFVTSVAGQGEPPQNGRTFFKALNAAVARGDNPLQKLRFSVFGMGDSHYWPRPEDAHYYNKPSKDLDARLEKLGGERIIDLGLGDDQDADGPETGYKLWEPLLWKALGIDSIEVHEAEPEPITNEHIKAASSYLRGTIAEGLQDTSTGALAPSDGQITKFHGIYQQDDRDIRDERQAQGVEPAYSFMIRVRMPGGVCQPEQWLQMDQIADEHGSGTFKITTRQTFQFHGVIKKHLKPSIQAINQVLLDTLAACGDVNRWVGPSLLSKVFKIDLLSSKGMSFVLPYHPYQNSTPMCSSFRKV